MARKTVEAAMPGALCLFFQGAAGNQGPIEGFTGDLGVAHRLGRTLGHQIAAVAEQIETVVRKPKFEGFVESTAYQAKQHWRVEGARDATLRFASASVPVPRRTYSGAEISGMRSRLERAQVQLEALGSSAGVWERYPSGGPSTPVRRFAEAVGGAGGIHTPADRGASPTDRRTGHCSNAWRAIRRDRRGRQEAFAVRLYDVLRVFGRSRRRLRTHRRRVRPRWLRSGEDSLWSRSCGAG